MIKLCENQIDYNGLKLSGYEKASEMGLESEGEFLRFPDKVFYDVTAILVNGGIVVSGRIEMTIGCQCVRCLKDYEQKISCEDVCHFYETGSKSEFDLTPELREDIIISLPQNFICSAECGGLCQICGKNKNVTDCGCNVSGLERSCWNELDKLSFAGRNRKKTKTTDAPKNKKRARRE
jgi:uncharacterized metal-binding protein YceD (DUF177 family)